MSRNQIIAVCILAIPIYIGILEVSGYLAKEVTRKLSEAGSKDYQQAMLSMVDRYQGLANETPIHTTCIKQARACKYYYATYRGE